jgi:hypothetical protein
VRVAGRGTTSGTLTAINGSTLTVNTANGAISVVVSSTTQIVRLYNAPSGLDEMSPGDALLVRGTSPVTGTINATWIKDESLQRAYTRMVGTVQAVGATTVTVMVDADPHGPTPFALGQTLPLNIGAATKIVSGTQVVTGTAGLSMLAAGTVATVLGTYDRVQNAFVTVDRIVIHKGQTGQSGVPTAHAISGTLVGLFGLTAPATLTVQTAKMGLVTVTVSATPTVGVVRRYFGVSSLDQLVPGDKLNVRGSFSNATTFTATYIQDVSLQAADTAAVVHITGIVSATTSFVGTVTHDVAAERTPFTDGSTVTVTVGTSTKILVPATAPSTGEITGTFASLAVGQKVNVLGIYDRKQHAYTITHLVRVHRS